MTPHTQATTAHQPAQPDSRHHHAPAGRSHSAHSWQHQRPALRLRWPSLVWGFALMLLALASLPAHARRVALLIGNGQYKHESVLRNPVSDVKLLSKTLRDMGFEVEALENLPKREMDLAIKKFVRQSAGANTALVYFAGHGQQPSKGGRSFLLPVDANTVDDDALETDGIPAEDIAGQLERQPNAAKLKLVILDACRNTRANTRSSVRGLAPPSRTDSFTLIAYSTDANAVAQDGQGANSPYAQALARNLPRAQREPVRRVFEDAAKEVRQATANQQSPRTYGDLESLIALDGVQLASVGVESTGRPMQADPEQEAWELAKRRDTVAAYEGFLASFPNGRLAASARSALAGLRPTPTPTPAPIPSPQPVQPQATPVAQAGQAFRDCSQAHCPELVVIPAGSFVMGSNEIDDEKPPHRVNIRSFALGKYEVTQGQWKAVMGSNPSGFSDCGDNCPVESVSWEDIQQYLQKLNGMTGMKYRLASEAEWEYAARAECSTDFNVGGQCREKIEVTEANFDGRETYKGSAKGEYRKKTVPVDSFRANGFGLHDMHGNVWEWVQDCFEDNYSAGQATDGSAHRGNDSSCLRRVLRGGSWFDFPGLLRSVFRGRFAPGNRYGDVGFRIARTVP